MNNPLIENIIERDIKNWAKALEFWLANADISFKEGNCLELSGRRGGCHWFKPSLLRRVERVVPPSECFFCNQASNHPVT
jgi:hypothetical protein